MPEAPAGVGEKAADLLALREKILVFLAACRQPVLKEEDAEPLAIAPDRFQLSAESDALLFDAWDERRTVSRRVVALRSTNAREMSLAVRKFGGRESVLTLSETELRGATLDRNLRRKNFRERFRAILNRQFPGATIEKLSAERDLRRSLSEHYARALLTQGVDSWAAIGVSDAEGPAAAATILTQGLLWLDHVRAAKLYLFVPESAAERTAQRIAWLNPARASYHVVPIPETDLAATVIEPLPYADPQNSGNFRTELRSPRITANIIDTAREKLRAIAAFPGVTEEITPNGELSLRFRGLEVAHASVMGVDTISVPMEQVARIRDPQATAANRRHPLYTRAAERWLESMLKADPSPLALEVAGSPVHSQILSGAGHARGVIDLLTITNGGRLVVIELKADEDQDLPLQALDYWIRVRWHLERGDFHAQAANLFPGRQIAKDVPLLWLVFPSIRLHPANEIVMKYFSPQIPVTRLGINEDWRKGVHVVFRA